MKNLIKFIVIMIVNLIGLQSKGQEKHNPILPYDTIAGHPIESVKAFLDDNTVLSNEWNNNTLEIVKSGMMVNNKTIPAGQDPMEFTLNHMHLRYRVYPGGYTNSRRTLDNVHMEFFTDKKPWKGYVWVFEYNGVSIDLYKDMCINLLKIPVLKPTSVEKRQVTLPSGEAVEFSVYNYNNNSINNSGNSEINNSGNSENTVGGGQTQPGYSNPPVEDEQWQPQAPRFIHINFGSSQPVFIGNRSRPKQVFRERETVQNPNQGLHKAKDADPQPFVNPNKPGLHKVNDADKQPFRQTTFTNSNASSGHHPSN